ncbi:protein-disulfide reductase DsbD [Sulfurimonas sp.]|uniref:protein-disulfide reductase DsbD n=1 Tax=Sulfurimonas sp. TaxID=2022749 RepID=UPI003569653E
MKKLLLLFFAVVTLMAAPKFLMPEEAFKSSAQVNDESQIVAKIEIAKDIYLYEESIKLELTDGSGLNISNIDSPEAIDHHGDMAYITTPTFIVYLENSSGATGVKDVEFNISYQGCSERGLCYEPYTDKFKLKIDTDKLQNVESINKLEPIKLEKEEKKNVTSQELSETDFIADTIKNSSLWMVLFTFFVFGLFLSLTPCVFPMVPIISGVIVSQCKNEEKCKAFTMSMVYVLAMSVAYTIAGVLAGVFGANLQAALQNPYVIVAFSGVFIALAFSMFGFYEIKIPDSIVSKVSKTGEEKGGMIGVAIMGFLSALIVGPCVAAPLAGALVYIGQTGDAALGGAALFAMSLGMGIPLILVGTSAGKLMPKPGEWMTLVNAFFGVTMVIIAIWMLERILDSYITMLAYSFTGIGFAYYLGLFDHEKAHHHVKKTIAMIIFVYSVALFIGVLSGSNSMTKPLGSLTSPVTSTAVSSVSHNNFTKVTSIAELDLLLEQNSGKKILLDFSADWCTACKELEKVTFSNEAVKTKMDEFVLIKADITANGEDEKNLSAKYGVFGPPAIIFFSKNSEVLSSKTIVGFIEPDKFLKHLNSI